MLRLSRSAHFPATLAHRHGRRKLYFGLNNGGEDKLAEGLPTRFNHFMPMLKASDYDYIIFDMPPVTQTSATPRLLGTWLFLSFGHGGDDVVCGLQRQRCEQRYELGQPVDPIPIGRSEFHCHPK